MNPEPHPPIDVNRIYRSNSLITILEQALFSLIRLSISPYLVLPFYLKQLTGSTFLIGLIPAVFVIGFALPQFLMVRILRRTRRPMRLLILSSLGQRLGMLGMFLLTIFQIRLPNVLTIGLFFAIYLFFNIARGCYSPTQIDFLGRGVPNNRGKIIGLGNFLGGIVNLFGTLLLTRLLTTLPYPQAITAVMVVSLAGSMVSFIAILFLKDVPLTTGTHTPVENLTQAKKVLPSPAFQKYLSWRAVIIGLEMMLPFYTLYGLDKFNLSASYVGIFAAIMTISDAVGNPFWGWLGDRMGYLRIIIIASFLGCAGAVLAAVAPNVIIFALVFLLNGLMLSGQSLSGVNIIYEFSPRREVPLYVAFHQVLLSLLSSLAPVIGASLTGGLGYAFGSLLAGVTGLIGTLGMQFKVHSPRLDKVKAPGME
jgi:MFS family permease